jgi:hypothetical protein
MRPQNYIYIYMGLEDTLRQTATHSVPPTIFPYLARPPIINYMLYMDYFTMDNLESIAYIDKDSNDVIIRFVGFGNNTASQLFITYAMLCMGFDFEPISMPSKAIH